jgi:hypothetical protein
MGALPASSAVGLSIVNNRALTIDSVSCQHFRQFPGDATSMPTAVNLKLPKRRLDGQAADVLREQILSGRFAPGLRLVEASLADRLGVSRGTVRAALSELAHEGLVSQVAYTKLMPPTWRCTRRS